MLSGPVTPLSRTSSKKEWIPGSEYAKNLEEEFAVKYFKDDDGQRMIQCLNCAKIMKAESSTARRHFKNSCLSKIMQHPERLAQLGLNILMTFGVNPNMWQEMMQVPLVEPALIALMHHAKSRSTLAKMIPSATGLSLDIIGRLIGDKYYSLCLDECSIIPWEYKVFAITAVTWDAEYLVHALILKGDASVDNNAIRLIFCSFLKYEAKNRDELARESRNTTIPSRFTWDRATESDLEDELESDFDEDDLQEYDEEEEDPVEFSASDILHEVQRGLNMENLVSIATDNGGGNSPFLGWAKEEGFISFRCISHSIHLLLKNFCKPFELCFELLTALKSLGKGHSVARRKAMKRIVGNESITIMTWIESRWGTLLRGYIYVLDNFRQWNQFINSEIRERRSNKVSDTLQRCKALLSNNDLKAELIVIAEYLRVFLPIITRSQGTNHLTYTDIVEIEEFKNTCQHCECY